MPLLSTVARSSLKQSRHLQLTSPRCSAFSVRTISSSCRGRYEIIETSAAGVRNMATFSTGSLQEFGEKHVTKGLGRLTEGSMSKGEGSYVKFEDGRRMLDFTCGIGVTGLGHCHPTVSGAAAKQCLELVHGQCSIAFHSPYLHLIEKLLPIMPHKSMNSFFFWNSGTEAVEAAIKMARIITKKQNIIAMQGGYHGRTFGAMAVTKSKISYSEGMHPLMTGVYQIPYPYWHQLGLPPMATEADMVQMSLYQLELLLKQQSGPKDTAAIIVEPVLGEGGYVPAPAAFLQGLRDVCDQNNILLIVDEVQCGFGRTGKYFYVENSGVKPDIMTVAKGLANGFPLSGVISRTELTDNLKPGSLGGTYAGNPVACAAAIAVTEVMKRENILDNVNERSKELFDFLNKQWRKQPSHIVDVRGQGLMVAIEFSSPLYSPHDPVLNRSAPKNLASRVAKRCIEKGLLLLTTSVYEVIRFIPPLNISQSELKEGCEIFAEALHEVVREG